MPNHFTNDYYLELNILVLTRVPLATTMATSTVRNELERDCKLAVDSVTHKTATHDCLHYLAAAWNTTAATMAVYGT